MFTPGSRLFFLFAAGGLVAAFVYAVATGDGGGVDYLGFIDSEAWIGALSLGWKGGVGDHVGYTVLLVFAAMSAFIACFMLAYRDADPEAVAELHGGDLPPSQRPTPPNYWPTIAAFGVGVVMIGLVVHAAIVIAGIIVLTAVSFEWTMAAWADRATGDPEVNKELRDRVMGPIEVPVLGLLGAAALILALSRVFLSVSAANAVWVAAGVAGVVFLAAIGFAMVDKVNRNLVAAIVVVGAVAVLAAGVVAAAVGERDFEHHEEEVDEHSDAEALGGIR